MATEWMTYAELGERIGVSPEAARQRAMRLKLRRQIGNDGKARVAVDLEEVPLNPPKTPVDWSSDTRTDAPPTAVEQVSDTRSDASSEHPAGDRLYDTLREQMTFLKEQLAKVEAIAEQRRLEADQRRQEVEQERERTAELTDDLRKLAERMAETERTAAQAEQARADLEKAKAELADFHAQSTSVRTSLPVRSPTLRNSSHELPKTQERANAICNRGWQKPRRRRRSATVWWPISRPCSRCRGGVVCSLRGRPMLPRYP